LLSHPGIVDCAVIGVRGESDQARPRQDEDHPRAYVVRRQGTRLSADDVKRHMSQSLASYKALTGGVVFLDEIPKSPAGKILKRVLREQADQEYGVEAKL